MKNIFIKYCLYNFSISATNLIISKLKRYNKYVTFSTINSRVKGDISLKLLKLYSKLYKY